MSQIAKFSVAQFLVLLIFYQFSFCQDLPKIVPPSPEAASLGKFSEVPISHYTGVPNISIPITTFSVGNKSFPVSIGYHARGIKVEETASRVGLGWALSAGGQISRQVRMKADDGLYGYFGSSVINDMINLANNPSSASSILQSCCIPTSVDQDKIPDQFHLQAGSLSAKFFFDYIGFEPLVQGYDDIMVEEIIVSNDIVGFKVTDSNGFKYRFGGVNGSITE